MNVIKVIPSGYCKGVVNAIKLAKQTRANNPNEKIYVLGMLVHNSFVSKELESLNIITLDDSTKTKEELIEEIDNGIVIFTAHGISEKIVNKVIEKGLKYVDATCVDVLKTQNIIKNYINKGYDIIYFGKKNHPEAEAILSISNNIHLVTNIDELINLKLKNNHVFLTNQTTMSLLEIADLTKKAQELYPNIIIEEEICKATTDRQLAIKNIKDCDLLYVVGDKKSNNTNKLVDVGLKFGIKKVILIQSYRDINKDDLIGINKIYVTAGASTPPQLIDEVINHLRTIFPQNLN